MTFQNIEEFIDWDTDKVDIYAKRLPSIFQYNEDVDKTAYMNWRMSFANSRRQFVAIGESYFSTAYYMIRQCITDNNDKKADGWIFPIMFNIVHGIEVYLKAINVSLCLILNKQRAITDGRHDIKELCSTAKNLIIEYKTKNRCNTTAQMFSAIKVIENFIANIYEKTTDMTFARYPMDKNKEGHFYIQVLENEVVDLELLEEQIVYVYKLLDFIFEMPEMELDILAEVMNEIY